MYMCLLALRVLSDHRNSTSKSCRRVDLCTGGVGRETFGVTREPRAGLGKVRLDSSPKQMANLSQGTIDSEFTYCCSQEDLHGISSKALR